MSFLRIASPDIAHAEDGHLEPSVEFDYDAIDRRESQPPEPEHSDEEIAGACKVITRLVEWIWQDGMKNTDGLQIRAAVVCWVFLAHLRPINEAQLAAGFGKHKQSVGRWVAKFKEKFPRIRIAHMKDSA